MCSSASLANGSSYRAEELLAGPTSQHAVSAIAPDVHNVLLSSGQSNVQTQQHEQFQEHAKELRAAEQERNTAIGERATALEQVNQLQAHCEQLQVELDERDAELRQMQLQYGSHVRMLRQLVLLGSFHIECLCPRHLVDDSANGAGQMNWRCRKMHCKHSCSRLN